MNKWLPGAILALSFSLCAQTIEPPVVKTQTQPEYPPELKYYLTDHPTVQLSIDEDGVPFALQSTTQIPDNVVQAIRRWRFEPAHQGNRAVAVAVSTAITVRRPLSEATALRRRWTSTKEIDEAYKTAKDLDESGLAALEQKIAQNPGDLTSRLAAVRYTLRHDSAANAALRLHHVRWFAEINPGFELLGWPAATPRRDQAGSEDYEALRRLWLAKLADNPSDPAILDNATNFIRISDPVAAEDALVKAVGEPDHALVLLGELYAFAAMGVTAVDPDSGRPSERQEQRAATPFAGQAREKLAKTENMRLLFSGLNATSGAGDTAFCGALRERAKVYFADARANCETVAPGNSGGGALRIGGNVVASSLIKQARPSYPQEAKSRHITGTVKFEARIGKDGKIHDLELMSGSFALYDSARGAVEKWEYRPTKLNGEPVEVITTIDVNYNLQ
jgi:TonB family protein